MLLLSQMVGWRHILKYCMSYFFTHTRHMGTPLETWLVCSHKILRLFLLSHNYYLRMHIITNGFLRFIICRKSLKQNSYYEFRFLSTEMRFSKKELVTCISNLGGSVSFQQFWCRSILAFKVSPWNWYLH